MRTINKLTKLVLSFLLVITCINFSVVQAEDGSDENYSEPTAVETISEEPVAEEPVIEEAAPVEEEKQEEVTPEVIEEAKVEEENNTPEIEAEPATQEETVEPEVQHEAPVAPEVQKVETVEEVKVTVVVSYVDESDHPLTDPITGSYPIEYRLDENVDVFKSFDGYAFEKMIVNDDAKNTISKDDVQKNGLRITKDMTSLKLVYQKMNLESNENKEVIPEVTEEAVEEAEPESSTNETELFAFDQTAFAGNVTVHVTAAEGVLPSGAQLIVKRVTRKAILNAVEETVTEKDKEVDSAIALDITIVNADGIEIQPNGIVNVSFENVAVGGEEVNIYHVTDDASTVTEVAANTQSFDANHFSIYVITGEKKVELTTFNFVANEQNVSTQIVKTGDTLITPTAPDIAGKAFVEWQENGSKFDGFGVQTITKTETRTITAKYEDALYVYFYNPEGTQIMRTEKVADHNGHDYSSVSYDVDATHKLVGWAAEANGTTDITNNIAVPEGSTSVNVYAIIKEGYWVTFDSDGGSAIDSQFVFDKISLNDQTTPTKPGYTFVGWYDGEEKVENGTTISSPTTLKAHWKATEVSYTVIHWWENADDDGYSFHESENKTGLTGTEANAKAKSYEGFTAQQVTKKTIKGDGSTIVSVYYKRNVYEVRFYSYSTWYTSSKEYTNLRITAKYGHDISKQWPTYSGSSTWSTKDNGSTYQANINTMPLGGAKFYGPQTGNYYCAASYYVEILPGENSNITVGGIKYRLDHTDKIYGSNIKITEEDQYPLKGFTLNESISARIGQRYDGAKFYYTRNSYYLKFINNGKVDKSASKKYEQSISGENYTPTRPSSLPEYYVFDGWYENELCEGEAYNFSGKKMPAQNVTLYAKWTASDVKLTYNLNNPEGDVVRDSKNVEAGTVASTVLPSIPTINEYSFAGWYYADGNGNITSEVFNTNNTITRDTSIVGKWLYKGELRVVYKPGSETGATVPTDGKVYAGGARVTVAGNATTTSDKKFLGWELNGNVYKPGQSFEVNKDIANKDNQIILTATWGDAETSTTLTYNPGNGIGTVKTVNVMNNEAVEIKAHNSDVLAFTAPVAEGKEYYFAGWADSKTGNATYADGQTINIDANGENVLYAVWVEKAEITLVANSGTLTYNGSEQSIKGFESTTMNGYTVSGLTAVTKGTNVGEYTNTVFDGKAKVEKDGVDVTDKVVVKTRAGKLVITPKSINTQEITVTKPADSKYDGDVHENRPVVKDTKTDATLVEGTDYTLSYKGDTTNVGTVTVTITGIGNYEGTVDTSYEITPAPLSITTDSANKVYDGNPLIADGRIAGLVNNEKVTFTVTGSQTTVGTSDNKYTLKFDQTAKEGNYSIADKDIHIGKLTVTQQTIDPEDPDPEKYLGVTVDTPSDVTYDGNEHKWTPTVSDADKKALTEGIDYRVSYDTVDFTNVHTIPVTIEGIGNYTGKVVRTYAITPAEVTVIANNANKVYGKADPELTATVSGTLGNDTVAYTLAREAGENAGKYKITVTGEENQGNYHVTYTAGEFEITKSGELILTAELTGESATKVYDGNPLTGGATANVKEGTTITYSTDGGATWTTEVPSITNVGTLNITARAENPNYEPAETTYSLTVTHATATVTAENKTKVYGKADPELTATVTGTLGNDTVAYTLAREAGENAGKYKITVTGKENQGNYKVTYTPGTFEITPKSIIPDGPYTPEEEKTGITVENPGDVKYDGKDHAEKPVVKDGKTGVTLEEGKDYEIVYPEDIKNAGEITATVVGKGDYEGSFEIKFNILKRDVTFTSATDSKQSDGNALTNGNVEITGDGFIEGEGAEYKVTGTQTQVGNSANEFEYTLNENTLASNYDITKVVGTLTVTAAPAPKTPEKPKPEVKKSVDTSDDNNIVFYGNAFFMAMITLAGIIVLRKKSS